MSKFDLRDISQRLSGSRDTEAVVFEFLGYLQALRPDWRATLAFYEVSRDALVSLYARHGDQLVRRDIAIPVDRLPDQLVRKFFHPNAFSNAPSRHSLLSNLFKTAPYYEPEASDAAALQALTPTAGWESCVCMPLTDQDDLLGILVLVSAKKSAFGARVVGDIVPVKSMAALALAQHLYRDSRAASAGERTTAAESRQEPAALTEFEERIHQLQSGASNQLGANHARAHEVRTLAEGIERADQHSSHYRRELERVKEQLQALEEQSSAATQHLDEAYSQLNEAQDRTAELQRTVGFLKDVFQALSQEHDTQGFPATMVAWFSEAFGVERCSLMVLDGGRETLRIEAQVGIDPAVASRVKVRIGQGISGWVALNCKPLFVRVKSDAGVVEHTGQDVYNSDSFIAVPLLQGDRLVGVLNLSNKQGGLPFDELDLSRATLAASLLAMTLGSQDVSRRMAAWA